MERLKEYRDRRDFRRSPEPAGGARRRRTESDSLFVVHKHDAQRLHFDLRLEEDGVLRSWALPKGPSLEPGEKRLAVQVEDHPLEYGDFEGVIPKKEYGGGTVMLWDRGHWAPYGKRKRGDSLDFVLDGEKLRGRWTLAPMRGEKGGDGKNWLLIKRRDTDDLPQPPEETGDRSVATGRTMAQIARDSDRTWTGDDEQAPDAPLPEPSTLAGARRRALPRDPRPLLATAAAKAPAGDDWLHELKLDGYRIMARLDRGKVRLLTRNGKEWTQRFSHIAELLPQLPARRALLDGEVVALERDGSTSFRLLQEAISSGNTKNLVYQLFDLPHLDGYDLGDATLLDRKQALAALVRAGGFDNTGVLRYSDHLQGQGPAFLERVCERGLEGIISKRADGKYRPGRGKQWLKAKCTRHAEFVVGGYTDPGGARLGFGSLLLGAYGDDGGLAYAGRVGAGFSDRQLDTLHRQLRRLAVSKRPFREPVPDAGKVHWVRPELVVEVEFTERTRDGRLRHPTFRGLREDRDPGEIRLASGDPPAAGGKAGGRRGAGAGAGAGGGGGGGGGKGGKRGERRVAGVRLTHPDRVLFPEQGATKLSLAQYYEEIQDWILPHLADRPLSLLRCPRGRGEPCFFQKHPYEALSARIPRIEIEEKRGKGSYVYVRSAADLVALVQAGVLELHPWGSRVDAVEKPDNMVFDLDPSPGLAWAEILRTAGDLRERLETLGLTSFLRTTGGKGLHLVVPLQRRQGWDTVKGFARAVAERHAADDPKRLTTNMSKAKREDRIFLDYLRNGRGATAIASYSTRAREGAPVAVPIRWDELDEALRPDGYNIDNLRRRLASLRADPWEGFNEARRGITRAMRTAVGMKK